MTYYQQPFKKRKQIIFLFLVLTLVSSASTYGFGIGDFDLNAVYAKRSNDGDSGDGSDGSGSNGDKKGKSSNKGSSDGGGTGQVGEGGSSDSSSNSQPIPDSSDSSNPEQQLPPSGVDNGQPTSDNSQAPLPEGTPLADQTTITDNTKSCDDDQPRQADGNCPPPLAASTNEPLPTTTPCPDNQSRDASGNCPPPLTIESAPTPIPAPEPPLPPCDDGQPKDANGNCPPPLRTVPTPGIAAAPPPTSTPNTGPGDLAAPPSSTDPDFCLKQFGRQQITGEPTPPECMPSSSPQPTTGGTADGTCPTGTYRSESTGFQCVPFRDQQPQQQQQQQQQLAQPPSSSTEPATNTNGPITRTGNTGGGDGTLPADTGRTTGSTNQQQQQQQQTSDQPSSPPTRSSNTGPGTSDQPSSTSTSQPTITELKCNPIVNDEGITTGLSCIPLVPSTIDQQQVQPRTTFLPVTTPRGGTPSEDTEFPLTIDYSKCLAAASGFCVGVIKGIAPAGWAFNPRPANGPGAKEWTMALGFGQIAGGYIGFIGGGMIEGGGALLLLTPGGQEFAIPVAAVGSAIQANSAANIATGLKDVGNSLQMASEDKGSKSPSSTGSGSGRSPTDGLDTSKGPVKTQWGYTGSPDWKKAVKEVGSGNGKERFELKDVNGKIPTQYEGVELIKQSRGKILRIESGHEAPNPHNYPHINYETPSGAIATLRIWGPAEPYRAGP